MQSSILQRRCRRGFGVPRFIDPDSAWKDTFQPAPPSPTNVDPTDHASLLLNSKWDRLPNFVATYPYMKQWNDTIIVDAQR
ncbi:hypothetical protein M407DRAFT_30497 [Tulasnella calospora MUT 4182]|uniref:Uncharacterized protein n=1 Tax=Tulasnella calospora MUT 4182 TaxID=1051891 RepID=A0A0C3Q791_9AGAM|nr:hypothetical protein M407DRAFT_30497 [Tulasnella calospora MUT 4182]